MVCPQCDATLVKAFIEHCDHTGWVGAWVCDCRKEDFERGEYSQTGSIIFVHADLTIDGKQVDEIFKG